MEYLTTAPVPWMSACCRLSFRCQNLSLIDGIVCGNTTRGKNKWLVSLFSDRRVKDVAMWQYGAVWCYHLNVMNNPAKFMHLWSTLHCQEHYGKREVNVNYALHSWLMPSGTACVKLSLLVRHFVRVNLISGILTLRVVILKALA